MKIVIHNVITELLIQTVFVTNSDNSYLFRCYHCGTAITRIKGEVVGITAGYIPNNLVPIINQCSQCRENYIFLSVSQPKDNLIMLTLSPEPNRQLSTFHCVVCRTPLLQYGNGIVCTLPLKQVRMPLFFNCLKDDCHRPYLLNEVVEVV